MSHKVIQESVEVYTDRKVDCGPLKNPLIFSLDVDTVEEARKWTKELGDLVGGIKLGPRLLIRYGESLIREIAEVAPVFVDTKYFDIASTTVAAVKATFETGASLCTVHAMVGAETLKQLADLEADLNQIRPFRILCVTILTSWDESSFPPPISPLKVSEHVVSLVDLVQQCGLKGVVCSAQELDLVEGRDLFLVTPGIRFPEDSKGDQKRILSPAEAMEKGATALVVGRPLLASQRPRDTAMDFLTAIFSRSYM